MDRLLNLPEEGELTSEMEKRVLDFAVNDVYGECAARWNLHYQRPILENLLRRVIARVGAQCEAADHGQLQEELKPTPDNARVSARGHRNSFRYAHQGRRDQDRCARAASN